MKKLLIVLLMVSINSLAATYTSTGNGVWSPAVGLPSNGFWGASSDIVYIDHAITFPSDFTFGGNSGYTLVIRNGGSLTITGKFTSNSATLTIDNGGTLTATNGLGANNNSGTFTINGLMNITGGGISQVANVWNIGTNGELRIVGDLNNDNSAMNLTVQGTVSVTGNANFHSGSYNIASGAQFSADGTTAVVGNANITNNGTMTFPNATTITTWGGSFDCDGGGSGTVSFGMNVDCSLACAGSSGGGCSSNVALPILLAYFEAYEQDSYVYFAWETIQEIQNDFFTIEYSYDALNFEVLLENIAGAGDSYTPLTYQESVASNFSSDIVYFRLKQTDYDGTYSYSDIIPLLLSGSGVEVFLYPNPVSSILHIQTADKENDYKATLVSMLGVDDVNESFVIEQGSKELDVSEYPEGIYFLYTNGSGGSGNLPKKVVVQHDR